MLVSERSGPSETTPERAGIPPPPTNDEGRPEAAFANDVVRRSR
jgi:hypothetical protein